MSGADGFAVGTDRHPDPHGDVRGRAGGVLVRDRDGGPGLAGAGVARRLRAEVADAAGMGVTGGQEHGSCCGHGGSGDGTLGYHGLVVPAEVGQADGEVVQGAGGFGGIGGAADAALYRIVVTRRRRDTRTRLSLERRTKQGMSKREIIRCLKRYVAREIYGQIQRTPVLGTPSAAA
ncbi:hypothetical protein ACWDBO_42095 [Streptomyces mirabilis]|uniref:hypothetical protein n=1 Tax=Streptomyces TaxID=1883 RepID=UPI0029C9D95B|nr:hypothetical protein [Streptomyces sp. AK02-04a]